MYKKTLVHRSLLCNVPWSCNLNNDQDRAINNNQTPPINNSLSQWECRTHNARLLWKSPRGGCHDYHVDITECNC